MINWYTATCTCTFISASVKTLEFLNTQYCNCFRIIIYLKPWNPIMFESGLYFTRPSFVVVYMSTVYKKCNGWKKILRNIGFKTNLFILRTTLKCLRIILERCLISVVLVYIFPLYGSFFLFDILFLCFYLIEKFFFHRLCINFFEIQSRKKKSHNI